MNASVFSDELQCHWICWRPMRDDTLALEMPADNCCDMDGAIRIAQTVMPQVRKIKTYAGGERDTEYRKEHKNKWQAYPLPEEYKGFFSDDLPSCKFISAATLMENCSDVERELSVTEYLGRQHEEIVSLREQLNYEIQQRCAAESQN